MRLSILYSTTIFILFFSASVPVYSQENSFRNSVAIKQQGNSYSFTKATDALSLKRDSFAIEFESKKYNEKKKKWYATQIAALTIDSLVSLVKPGQQLENLPFFSEGTGLAAEQFGYTNLFIDNEAHHYITYTDEKDRRAESISVKGDLVKLRWNIPLAYYQEQDIAFNKLPLNNFYLVIFNDGNLNQIIEEGEYGIIYITLK